MFLHWNPKSKRTLEIAPAYPNIVRIFTSESGSKMYTEIATKCTHAGVVLSLEIRRQYLHGKCFKMHMKVDRFCIQK